VSKGDKKSNLSRNNVQRFNEAVEQIKPKQLSQAGSAILTKKTLGSVASRSKNPSVARSSNTRKSLIAKSLVPSQISKLSVLEKKMNIYKAVDNLDDN
jgi:hypothetical protein